MSALAISEKPERPCVEVDSIARRHVEDIDRRIAQLIALRRELQTPLARAACRSH